MTTTTDEAKQALIAAATLARNWQELCRKYKFNPHASPEALENAIKHEGFAHAVLSMQGLLGDLVQMEKHAYRNGDKTPTLQ